MKRFLITTQNNTPSKIFDFPNVDCAIRYVVDNPFEFVTFRLLDSKQIHIFELHDDGEYYVAACVENALTGSYFYETV
ncbi:MAG: hypothetical protein MRZ61_09985 [Oscillospiraceae bacterium]|nr:hypothetical protein [Oscillospiraceae bacterium]